MKQVSMYKNGLLRISGVTLCLMSLLSQQILTADQSHLQVSTDCVQEETAPARVVLGKKQIDATASKKGHAGKGKANVKSTKSTPSCQTALSPRYDVKSVGVSGKTLVTSDETIWEISARYASIAANWPKNTAVIIKPNSGFGAWFSTYEYRLCNAFNGESVEADLSQGPFKKHSVFIAAIDRARGLLQLTDGSCWNVQSYASLNKMQAWKEGQAILFGESGFWFDAPYILINVNENQYITAGYCN